MRVGRVRVGRAAILPLAPGSRPPHHHTRHHGEVDSGASVDTVTPHVSAHVSTLARVHTVMCHVSTLSCVTCPHTGTCPHSARVHTGTCVHTLAVSVTTATAEWRLPDRCRLTSGATSCSGDQEPRTPQLQRVGAGPRTQTLG